MKKVIISGIRQAEWVDVHTPTPVKDWALVKITTTPMCTEYKAFQSGIPTHFLGHEAVGEVVEIAQSGKVKVGDRVVVMPQYPCGICELCISGDYIHCENLYDFLSFTGSPEGSATYGQFLIKPDWLLPKIPDDVSDEMASLTLCALGPSFAACEKMNVSAFDTFLITGAGPVGLGAVINAHYRGARVIVIEGNPYRTEKAYQLGADLVIDPSEGDVLRRVHLWSGGMGIDKVLDCSGVVAAQRLCIDAVRRKGQIAFVGECNQELPVKASPDLIRKGISIHGIWHYNLTLFPKIIQLIRNSSNVLNLVSHVLPMKEVQKAFEISESQQCAKILLKPWD